jgi:epoxyqueuosine reductase QueG
MADNVNTDHPRISADELRKICLGEGADDAGFVDIGRDALSMERDDILRVFSGAETLISVAKKVNPESIQSPSVSVADYEFSRTHKDLYDVTGGIIKRLNSLGIRGVTVPPGFPMDLDRWPGKMWEASHKLVAVEGGIGHMGISRIVIHPTFGNHMILDTLLINAKLNKYDSPLEDNPCIECRLCVSVCPVGAIGKDGDFDFMSCAMHNYHDLFGGFQEWVEEMVASGDVKTYRSKFTDGETATKWQSITYGHFYRCSYCMAVCPAGSEPLKTYESDKKLHVQNVVRPLREKREPLYVIKGTAAEDKALKNANKFIRYVKNKIRPSSVETFLAGIPLLFNPKKAEDLDLTLHFVFSGNEEIQSTVSISGGAVDVKDGLNGKADLRVNANSETWVGILNEEVSPIKSLLTGKLRLKGNPSNLGKFKNCIL